MKKPAQDRASIALSRVDALGAGTIIGMRLDAFLAFLFGPAEPDALALASNPLR